MQAIANPINYNFSTGSNPFGNQQLSSLLGTEANVSGSFTYDQSGTYYGLSEVWGFEPGYSIYAAVPGQGTQTYSGLTGNVGGRGFSDERGSFSVSDNQPQGFGRDILTMSADPTPYWGNNSVPYDRPRQLNGFSLGEYSLINVRLFWIDSTGTFLDGVTQPNQLPSFSGRLALDFIRTNDPQNLANVPFYSNTVFFDGLTVSAVPEPSTLAMLLAGVGIMTVVGNRRRFRKT